MGNAFQVFIMSRHYRRYEYCENRHYHFWIEVRNQVSLSAAHRHTHTIQLISTLHYKCWMISYLSIKYSITSIVTIETRIFQELMYLPISIPLSTNKTNK